MGRGIPLRVLALLVCVGALSACGGSSSTSASSTPDSARSALSDAGWTVNDGRGMKPISPGRQLAWLDVRSPSGQAISLQFLEDADHARNELAAIRKGVPGVSANPRFQGTTIGSILAFAAPNGHMAITQPGIDALRRLLGNASA